jgi:hypothetical protein
VLPLDSELRARTNYVSERVGRLLALSVYTLIIILQAYIPLDSFFPPPTHKKATSQKYAGFFKDF